MNFGMFVSIFVLLAGIERLWETTLSRRAVRGQKRQGWSFAYFATLHVVIFAGTAVEYFLLKPEVLWPATVLGLVLFGVSLVVRLAAIRALGRFWSLHLEIRAEHQLVTDGIYRYVRHPAYSAILLEVISVPLVGNAYVMLLVALLAYWPVLLARWRKEEQAMIEKFGDRYRRYRREVPAFVPRCGCRAGRDTARLD